MSRKNSKLAKQQHDLAILEQVAAVSKVLESVRQELWDGLLTFECYREAASVLKAYSEQLKSNLKLKNHQW